MEIYAPDVTGKFLTLTGKAIHGADVNERSEQLQRVLDKYMKRPNAEVTAPVVDAPGSFLSDESVYAKVSKSKQADKFNALWNGEIPDGKSPSEADMALAEILAFWCGGDTDQMDRLFRRSGLMRDKWDRVQSGSTYGMITLTKAVKKCSAFYSPMMATAEIIRSFVERIDVYKPEKVPGTRTKKQTICIHWNFIGAVDIPAEHEKTA